jgi:hypothetical protein
MSYLRRLTQPLPLCRHTTPSGQLVTLYKGVVQGDYYTSATVDSEPHEVSVSEAAARETYKYAREHGRVLAPWL